MDWIDELTKLGIRITVLETKEDMLLERCNRAIWKSEDLQQEVVKLLAEKDKQIADLREKLYILAGAVKKLAVDQGRLPEKPKKKGKGDE